MTAERAILLAAGGSVLLLALAFAFQVVGGLAPCQLCLWQRWPHAAAAGIGAAAMVLHLRILPILGAVAAGTAGALGIYHTGVERGWWPGPAACSGDGGSLSGLSGADLLSLEGAAPIVMCDEVVWSYLGLSMASWNAVASFALMGVWLWAVATWPGRQAKRFA